MDDWLYRVIHDLIGRLDGPLHFRFILQPLMSIFFATRDGIRDAHAGQPAYGWAVFTNKEHRRPLLKESWTSVGNVFLFAVVMDVIYQIVVFRRFYPTETLLTALVLAFVPYMLLRGPINRIAQHWLRGPQASSPARGER